LIGKSTLAKQFKILFITGFNDEEKRTYIPLLFSNILTGIIALIELADKRGWEINDQESKQKLLEFEQIRMDTPKEVMKQLANLTNNIWKEEAIQNALADGFGIPDSTEYIINRMDEMLSDNYLPNNQDILRCRVKTTGAYETTFAIQNIPIRYKKKKNLIYFDVI
jgi:hypothetical protein